MGLLSSESEAYEILIGLKFDECAVRYPVFSVSVLAASPLHDGDRAMPKPLTQCQIDGQSKRKGG